MILNNLVWSDPNFNLQFVSMNIKMIVLVVFKCNIIGMQGKNSVSENEEGVKGCPISSDNH